MLINRVYPITLAPPATYDYGYARPQYDGSKTYYQQAPAQTYDTSATAAKVHIFSYIFFEGQLKVLLCFVKFIFFVKKQNFFDF